MRRARGVSVLAGQKVDKENAAIAAAESQLAALDDAEIERERQAKAVARAEREQEANEARAYIQDAIDNLLKCVGNMEATTRASVYAVTAYIDASSRLDALYATLAMSRRQYCNPPKPSAGV